MIVNKYEPHSLAWFEARRNHITATEVAALFGLDAYQSAEKVKRGKLEPIQIPMNPFMRAGQVLEPGVFIAMKLDAGIHAGPVDTNRVVMVSDGNLRLSASLDGIADHAGSRYIVEAKTMTLKKFTEDWKHAIPIKYFLQVQVQMMLSQQESCLVAGMSYEFPLPLTIFQVFLDQEVATMIREEVVRFWELFESDVKFKVNKQYKQRIEEICPTKCLLVH